MKLQVEYEKMFPNDFLDLKKYKKSLDNGLIKKLSNADFEEKEKIREHLLTFNLINSKEN